jgi:hypothetical protein
VHPLVKVLFLDVGMWRSKCTIPIFFEVHWAMPRTQGKPIEWSPPIMTGSEPAGKHMADRAADLVEAFSRLAGMVNTSPASHSVICSRRSIPIS